MTQEYTPVTWVDETENQVGTVINKARLDQMQTAHHYADGFKEVDAVPTQDPGVDYHMVVYCTADTSFYRWDGTQWTKDIDDPTAAALAAHEADHNNPHVVTKAQVGLGNVDNKASVSSWQTTPDNDHIPTEKLVKDSLDAKLDDSQLITSWSGAVSNDNIPSEKLVKDTIDATDAEVAKIKNGTTTVPNATNATYLGSSSDNVGGDLKPIKIVGGQAQPVTYDLVDVPSAQNITGAKTFMANVAIGAVGDAKNLTQVGNFNITGDVNITGNITQNGSAYETHAEQIFSTKDYINLREGQTGALASGDYSGLEIIKYDGTNNGRIVIDNAGTLRVGDVGDEQPLLTRAEVASMTSGALLKWDGVNLKAVTEGTLGTDLKPIKLVDGVPTPVTYDLVDVHSNQTINGEKSFKDRLRCDYRLYSKNPNLDITVVPTTNQYDCGVSMLDKNDNEIGSVLSQVYANSTHVHTYILANSLDAGGGRFEKRINLIARSDNTGWVEGPYRSYAEASNDDMLVKGQVADMMAQMPLTSGTGTVYGGCTLENVSNPIRWYKVGRICTVIFAIRVDSTYTSTYAQYCLATGVPAAAIGAYPYGSQGLSVDGQTDSGGALGYVNTSGHLYFLARAQNMAGKVLVGSVTYITA